MTSARIINTLKKVNKHDKDAVFSYIRQESKSLLSNGQTIPKLIEYLCLMFYYSKWDKSKMIGEQLKVEGNKLTFTHKCLPTKMYNAYLKMDHCFKWKFTINKCRRFGIACWLIGLRRMDVDCFIFYAFSFSDRLKIQETEVGTSFKKYGQRCIPGDVIIMTLNNWKLQYKVNNTDYGIAFDIPPGKYAVIVRATKHFSITVS